MPKRIVVPQGIAPSGNPTSAAVITGNLVYVSGQVSTDSSDVTAQTRAVLERIRAILAAAGTDLSHVVNAKVYLRDAGDFQTMNGVFKEFFPRDPPSRTTIVTALVLPAILVEIDCVAEHT